MVTDQITLNIGYDIIDKSNAKYYGKITKDMYGRIMPKQDSGTIHMKFPTSSTKLMTQKIIELYENIVNRNLFIKRLNISVNHLTTSQSVDSQEFYEQLDLFSYFELNQEQIEKEKIQLEEEKRLQKAIIDIKKKYGKNSILKVMDLQEDATTRDKNNQIGGHKA